jgi:hypothetical protein
VWAFDAALMRARAPNTARCAAVPVNPPPRLRRPLRG